MADRSNVLRDDMESLFRERPSLAPPPPRSIVPEGASVEDIEAAFMAGFRERPQDAEPPPETAPRVTGTPAARGLLEVRGRIREATERLRALERDLASVRDLLGEIQDNLGS